MLSTIGSSPSPIPSDGASGAVLAAQLARCQVQQSDWVHCASSETPEGKAKIAEISDKISAIKRQMQSAESAQLSVRQGRTNSISAADSGQDQARFMTTVTSPASASSVSRLAKASAGNQIDVFA